MDYISMCGLLCNNCGVFIATHNDDDELKEQLAKEFSTDEYEFSKEGIRCHGCRTTTAETSQISSRCGIRMCGLNMGISNCSECSKYSCDILDRYFPSDSENLLLLDKMVQEKKE